MLHLLPPPRSLAMNDGSFSITQDAYIVLTPGAGTLMRTAARQLRDEVQSACGFAPHITIGKARSGDILLTLGEGVPQGYALSIAPDSVTLTGHDEAGVLHGVQTLRQIIRQSGWNWPCLTVEDAPAFPHRGFYHDQTRGRVATLDYLKSLADEMCLYKMNQLQLYVEHTYLFRDITELWSVAVTPLTSDDILELDDYCAARGIELVPSLSSFGHLLELLRTKRFSPLCELPDAAEFPSTMPNRMAHHTIDPTDERAFLLVASMIDEYLPLFRTDKFNICCDETFDLGKGKNAGKDVGVLYMSFLKKLCDHAAAQGKTPMFWGDIVLKYPEALAELPEGAICLNWGYSADEREDATRKFAEAGAVQYVCPGVDGWSRFMPNLRGSHENIRRMAEYGKKYGAAGLLNTDWGDYGHVNDPRFSLPGMVAGACASWSDLSTADDLWRSVSVLAYGDASGKEVGYLAELSECVACSWWAIVQHKEWATGQLDHRRETSPMGRIDSEKVRAMAARIEQRCAELRSTGSPMVSRWLIAAEAIALWNRVGACISAGEKAPELAINLEKWLYRYEMMWREVSRESELWRIRDVARWYAEQLR